MIITIRIDSCSGCRHLGHSGAFTTGGAKPVCEHGQAWETATVKKAVNKKDPDDKYHWRHRVINEVFLKKGQPYWCPLKHGSHYW